MGIIAGVLGLILAGCATASPVATNAGQAPTTAIASTQDPINTAPAVTTPAAAGGTAVVPETGGSPIVYNLVASQSSADYRVQEQLANLNFPTQAVGKTNAVSGSIAVQPDGTVVSSQSKFVIDVSSLQSDKSMRDRFVSGNILQTSQYPQVVFVPTSISGLSGTLPQSGNTQFQLTGNLTIRDVTKPVTWQVNATVQGNQVTGQATTSFKFEDFNLSQPRVPVVLSVVDNIALEMNFTLQK
jgi:polyisoprenoid-binding protein YceI